MVSRAPCCGCDGEEGAWGGDIFPEEKDKSQIPLKQHHHPNRAVLPKSTGS